MTGKPRSWALLFALAMVCVTVLALLPSGGGQDWFPQADKLRHAVAFAVLWGLGWCAGLRPGIVLAVGLLTFGVGIELAQSLTPDREASLWDVLADVLGITLGWAQLSTPRQLAAQD